MTATVLVSGKLFKDPEAKTSRGGNRYAMATLRDGQGDDVVWWKVFAFADDARDELLELRAGDGVSVSGSFKAEVYAGTGTPRVSLSVIADRLISAKRRKRERDRKPSPRERAEVTSGRPWQPERPFDVTVPF